MTIRECYKRRLRWIGTIVFVGVIATMAGVFFAILGGWQDYWGLMLPGFVFMIGSSLWGQCRAFRCPQCRGNCGTLYSQNFFSRSVDRVNFCPFCGVDVDMEMVELEGEATSAADHDSAF